MKCILGTLAVAAGLVFAGVVAYKIIKKKSPNAMKGVEETIANAKAKTSDIFKNAKASFQEGYSQA